MSGRPRGCNTCQVSPPSVLAASTARPLGAVLPEAVLTTGLASAASATPPAKIELPACARLVLSTPLGPVVCHVLPPSVERYRPLLVPSTSTFGSVGDTAIVQYHPAEGAVPATSDSVAGATATVAVADDLETAPLAANPATNA